MMGNKRTNNLPSLGGVDADLDCDIFEASGALEGSNNNSIFILDSGDLRLLVTYSNDRITFVVSSHAISLASPIWKKILHPPFHRLPGEEEDNALQDKQIDFSEDKGEALLPLLRIAHLQFSKVPPKLTFKSILDIAVLCDKYDCVGLVKPWLPLWLVNEEIQYREPKHEEWLFIAWVFGREKTFRELATKLVKEVKTSHKGDCLTSAGEILPSQMPPDIIGKPCIMHYALCVCMVGTFSSLKSSTNRFCFFREHISHSS